MKKFLFVGDTNGNTGPANVNKGIVANLSDAFCIADSVNKVKKYINAFIGVVRCKVIVVSGMSKVGVYAIKFGLIFAVICMIALPEVEHKGLKKCLIHQWHKLRTDKITRYKFAFFTILFMVLSRTLICRSIWQCPWENIIGEWGGSLQMAP